MSLKERNKIIAIILAITAGCFGIILGGLGIFSMYKLYSGNFAGILYLLFCWTFIRGIIDFIEGVWLLIMPPEEFNQRYN